ncbi:MAG: T9SS type A sorting domain-containing protein [Calditrichaceae bacterium]|nr:T9SS type A sorting domain-containing protein [Calditrichaceae bacterium]RQV92958.1 MAG: T9SS C-terminal target domain-containing protein [Calditrichota bacterium]
MKKNLHSLVFVFACFCLMNTYAQQQDILFHADFETGGYSPFSEPAIIRGAAEIVDSAAFCGVYAFKSYIENETSSGSRRAYIVKSFADKDSCPETVWAKFYFKLDNSFTHTQNNNHALITSFARTTVGGIARVFIYHNNSNLYLGLFGSSAATRAGGTTPLTRNTWYCCELEYDTLQGRMAVYLDGNKEVEFTGLSAMSGVNELRLGWDSWMLNQSGNIYFDNAQVSIIRKPYQAQEMSVIAPPSFFGRIGMKFIVSITNVNPDDKFKVTLNGESGYEEQIYFKEAGLEKNFEFTMNLRTLNTDDYTLRIELLNVDDVVIADDVRTFSKPYDGVPMTGIDENAAVCLNGEPVFFINTLGLRRGSINFWMEHNFCNLLAGYFDKYQTPENWVEYLDYAQTAETYAIGPLKDTTWVNRSARDVPYPTLDEIEIAVEANKNHPALFFWDWMDEPISNNQSITGSTEGNAALVRSWTEKTHAHNPQHLVFTSEWATLSSFEHVQSKIFYPNWVADVYSFDLYALEFEADTGDKMAEVAEINERYYRYNYGMMPFSSWIETCDVRPLGHDHDVSLYPPTQEQLRMLCWIPIIHGAKGLSWFPYFGPTPPENFIEMSEIVNFTNQYQHIILSPEPKEIKVVDDADILGRRVDAMVRETETDLYVFAIRISEVAGHVYVNPLEQGDIPVNFEIEGITLGNGTIEDVFSTFKSAHHQEWDVETSGQTFNLALDTPLEPGSLIIGGGYLSSNSDVGHPTKWVYLYDDGYGNLKPEYAWEDQEGTINYETGAVYCDFKQDIDAGEAKIHAGFFPKETSVRNLTIENNHFSDVFERCELHAYRIPKTGAAIDDRTTGLQPSAFYLAQNYPNPFNPVTNIEFRISKTEFVTLKIYDILGREIITLVNEQMPAGIHTAQWNGRNGRGQPVVSGIYYYQIQTGDGHVSAKKMLLLK